MLQGPLVRRQPPRYLAAYPARQEIARRKTPGLGPWIWRKRSDTPLIYIMQRLTILNLGSPPRLRRPNTGVLAGPASPNLATLSARRPPHQRVRLVPLLQFRRDGGHRIRAVVRDAGNGPAAFCAELAQGGHGAAGAPRAGSVGVLYSHQYSGAGGWV